MQTEQLPDRTPENHQDPPGADCLPLSDVEVVYGGDSTGANITVDGEVFELRNHAADIPGRADIPMGWGPKASRDACWALAYSLLAEVLLDTDRAFVLAEPFVEHVVRFLRNGWRYTKADLVGMATDIGREVSSCAP